MERVKRFSVLILSVILLACLLPGIPVSAEAYGEYHAGDVEIINTLIEDHDLDWGIWEKEEPDPPPGWASRIQWTEEYPGNSIRTITILGENAFKPKTIDLRGLSTLGSLYIVESSITGINLEGLTSLNYIDLHGNSKLAVVKAGGLTSLTSFISYGGNLLTSLDLSDSSNLSTLDCLGNRQLASLNLGALASLTKVNLSSTAITSLDVSKMSVLVELDCDSCNLTSLKLGSHPSLSRLSCGNNSLGSLDVSGAEALEELDCNNCNLTSLKLGSHPSLRFLSCGDNPLNSLDVSRAEALERLDCSNCYLTSLKLEATAPYDWLDVRKNLFPLLPQDADITGRVIEWDTGDYYYLPQREKALAEEAPETFTGSGDRTVTFEDPDIETFNCLRRNGELVDEGNYQVQAGSTIIILKESYLETLSLGMHQFIAEWDQYVGSFDLEIGVLGAEETKPTTTVVENEEDEAIDVSVGESYNFLPLVLILAGLTLLAAAVHLRTRKQSQGD